MTRKIWVWAGVLWFCACGGGDDATSNEGRGGVGNRAGSSGTAGGGATAGAGGEAGGAGAGAGGSTAGAGAGGAGAAGAGGAGTTAGGAGSGEGGAGLGGAGGAGQGGAGLGGASGAGAGGAAGALVGKFGCTEPDLIPNPFVAPEGFTGHEVPWSDLYFGATFPQGPSHLSPVGSFTLRAKFPATKGPPMNARFLYTPFVPEADKNYKVGWVGAQPIAVVQYGVARGADSVFVSVSRCPGDLRPRDPFSTDMEIKLCRGLASNGNLFFGTTANAQCKLVPGKTYYLNIAMVQPNDGLTLDETTCADQEGKRCEANFDAL